MKRGALHKFIEGFWYISPPISMRVPFVFIAGLAFTISAFTTSAFSQPLNPEIRIAAQEETNAVYIYHTALPAISHGFNIYRKAENEDEFRKINLDPIRGVTSGTELRAYLGTLYDDIQRITDQSKENETLTKVRSDIRTANLLTFIYPKMAEALGRLYIDNQAPLNQLVTYRIEFVDALDRPTGVVLEKSEIIFPKKPLAPIYLRAENKDDRITLYWQYPVLSENSDDKVIQFVVYRIDPTTNQHEQVNNKVILKNDAVFEYAYSFDVSATGQTEKLYIKAIDISGQPSDASELLNFETIDSVPPNAIVNVSTQVLSGYRVLINWQANTIQDVAGFNLYRSASLSDKSSYVRLNEDLLSPLESTFNDTLKTEASNKVYYYRVTALDAQGNEGPFSTAAMALLEDETAPSAPTSLTAQYKDGTIDLSWKQSDLPDDFESFIVLRHIVDPYGPIVPSRVNPELLTETSFSDPGIAGAGFSEGATYRYEVISTDNAGNYSTAISTEIQIPDLSPPNSPNGVQAMRDNASRVAIYWNPSSSQDIMSYLIYRREAGSSRIQVTPHANERLRYLDNSVKPGVTYEYWVTAADHSGNESLPSAPVTILMRDTIAPRNVRNVQATSSTENEAIISWEPVPSYDLAGYKVFRSESMTGNFEPLFDRLIKTTQWTDQNAVDNAWYTVHAIDTSGNISPASTPIRAFKPLSTNN